MAYRYKAFISYSHADAKWGDWLHKGLETYKIPKDLIGTDGRDGAIPEKLFPVFRDREELPTSDDLGSMLIGALEESAYLLVICSPNSAQSKWVNEEILSFKRMGKENRILALIADGEPGGEGNECFPPALKFKLGPDGDLSSVPTEPIAADARPGKDGRKLALLKLISGVLGVKFDALNQREKKRQKKQRIVWAVAASAILGVIGGVWYAGEQNKRAEEQARYLAETEQLATTAYDQYFNDRPIQAIETALSALPLEQGDQRPFNPTVGNVLGLAVQDINPIGTFRFLNRDVGSLFTPDGAAMLTFEYDSVALYSVETFEQLWHYKVDRVLDQWITQTGTIAVFGKRTGEASAFVAVLDPQTGKELTVTPVTYDLDMGRASARKFGPKSTKFVVGQYADVSGERMALVLVDAANGDTNILAKDLSSIFARDYWVLPDDRVVMETSDGTVFLFDRKAMHDAFVLQSVDNPEAKVTSVAVDPSGRIITATFDDGGWYWWLLRADDDGKPEARRLTVPGGRHTNMLGAFFFADGNYVGASNEGGSTVWFHLRGGTWHRGVGANISEAYPIPGQDGLYRMVGRSRFGGDTVSVLWSSRTYPVPTQRDAIGPSARYNPVRQEWVIFGENVIATAADPIPEVVLDLPRSTAELSPTGKYVVSASPDTGLIVQDTGTGTEVVRIPLNLSDGYLAFRWFHGDRSVLLWHGTFEFGAADEWVVLDLDTANLSEFSPVNIMRLQGLESEDVMIDDVGNTLILPRGTGVLDIYNTAGVVIDTIAPWGVEIAETCCEIGAVATFDSDQRRVAMVLGDGRGVIHDLISGDEMNFTLDVGDDYNPIGDIQFLEDDVLAVVFYQSVMFVDTRTGSLLNTRTSNGLDSLIWVEGHGLALTDGFGTFQMLTSNDRWQSIGQDTWVFRENVERRPNGDEYLTYGDFGDAPTVVRANGSVVDVQCDPVDAAGISEAHYSPDGRYIVAWDYSTVCVLDAERMRPVALHTFMTAALEQAILTPDSTALLVLQSPDGETYTGGDEWIGVNIGYVLTRIALPDDMDATIAKAEKILSIIKTDEGGPW